MLEVVFHHCKYCGISVETTGSVINPENYIIRKDRVCEGCKKPQKATKNTTLDKFI
jgi:hypothetical protein